MQNSCPNGSRINWSYRFFNLNPKRQRGSRTGDVATDVITTERDDDYPMKRD